MLFSRLKFPLLQAPMAGGFNTVEMAAIVANYGCVGSFGFAYSTPETIDEDLRRVKTLTTGNIQANFFVFQDVKPPSLEATNQAVNSLRSLPFGSDGVEYKIPSPPFFPDIDKQLEPIWKHKPSILTFHFGLPPITVLERARSLGIAVGVSCTSLRDFHSIQDFGATFAIAQGIEAGGHRGTFIPNEQDDEELTVDELLRRIVPVAKIPIVAAGGLMTGGDIARVRSLGASAAQLGTRFLTCEEAGTSSTHRRYILERERETLLVNAFSGRRARGLRNEFIDLMEGRAILPFPLQNILTGSLRGYAKEHENGEYQSLWAGSRYQLCETISTQSLLSQLENEYLQDSGCN